MRVRLMHRLITELKGSIFLEKKYYEIEGSRLCSKICITEVCLLKYYIQKNFNQWYLA